MREWCNNLLPRFILEFTGGKRGIGELQLSISFCWVMKTERQTTAKISTPCTTHTRDEQYHQAIGKSKHLTHVHGTLSDPLTNWRTMKEKKKNPKWTTWTNSHLKETVFYDGVVLQWLDSIKICLGYVKCKVCI